MLARAVAGEADVPFFYTSGSEFEEVGGVPLPSHIHKRLAKR